MVRCNEVVEASLLELLMQLGADTGKDDVDAIFLVHADEVGEVVDARGIDERNLTHADDADTGLLVADVGLQLIELVGDAEEEGTVDLIYGTTFGNGQTVMDMAQAHFIAGIDFVVDDTDLCGLHDAFHEEGTSGDETHLNGDGEVEDDGEEKGGEQHQDITLGVVHEALQRAPTAHVIADDDQHGSQGSHGYVLGIRHENEQDEQKHHGMDDAGNGCAATVVDVGHGAGNGTGCGDAAKERRDDIGRSLGDEFHVAVVLVSGNAIGHGCTEQTLDGTQNGNGEGHGHELLDEFESDVGHYHIWQLGLDLETVANGVDAGDAEELFHNEYGYGAEQNAIERAGNLVEHRNAAGVCFWKKR